ncbi:hypothetical protein [Natrarchaeobius chitinivorans]|uniref:Uncharacterized protein n=1 Tax=Natrarchaeobius chitinivorans TaxID=1679083 RepID=A0A3N6LUW1_NATCH|nr:hypothetical protein [Natrarchaeobius chitinivorans]RQG92497.1 hypothetical protein EA473_15875 [Natrarchaeobius chitinivorans]
MDEAQLQRRLFRIERLLVACLVLLVAVVVILLGTVARTLGFLLGLVLVPLAALGVVLLGLEWVSSSFDSRN